MAADNSQNTGVKNNIFIKGMNKDSVDIFMSDQAYTHAINAINNSHTGETGTISNEPSNYLFSSAPYTIIGTVHKSGHDWVICSTNDRDSEIGIFNEITNEYTTVVNDPCLGFKKTNLITGVCKENYDCTRSFYFQDGLNPDRVINLNKVPYKVIGDATPDPNCYTPIYGEELDCDALLLHPLVKQPCIRVKKSQGAGQLNNGSYMAVVAYSENGIKLTDYSVPSNPQALWSHTGIGGGIDITITDLDQDFEEYELVVIAIINQETVAKKVGNYSTRQSLVTLDLFNASLESIPLKHIPVRSVVYEKSDKMFTVNNYLIRTGVTTQPLFNYQPQANRIQTEWVAVEYPSNYYWNGGNATGYMRDEVYTFFVRWVYKTGLRSPSYHIPGRPFNGNDRLAVSGSDVLYPNETERWQVYDTSTKTTATGSSFDGGVVVNKGQMSYWESTEKYPDNEVEIWGELCGKPIRHHKMPSNEVTHIHNQGGDKIYVLGVQFSNIQHPVDNAGKPIADIVGFEILRGSREGNRTVVAKGLFNNMWEYTLKGNSSRKGLYQNYPYNDLRPDRFLNTNLAALDSGSGSTSTIENLSTNPAPSTYKKNYFSFHSPETNFVRPYVGQNYIKVYTEEKGTVIGNFEVPYKHPKHKMMSNASLGFAGAIGLGIGLMAAIGKTTLGGYDVPGMTDVWTAPYTVGTMVRPLTKGFNASRESSAATIIPDLIAGAFSNPFGAGTSVAGIAAFVAGSTFYVGQGINQIFDTIYKLGKFRNYVLQYNSHGLYDQYSNVVNSAAPIGAKSFRRQVATSGSKYISSGLQDFDATYRVNNVNRNKYLAIKLTADLPNPVSATDNTRQRVRDVSGISHKDPFNTFNTTTVAYYGAIKVDYENQYGQLQSIIQLPTDSCIYKTIASADFAGETGVIFGGDVYINRYTEKNPYYFFNTWLHGEPNGFEFDYRNYVNGPAPRYWADFSEYDLSDLNFSITMQSNAEGGGPLYDAVMGFLDKIPGRVLENFIDRIVPSIRRPTLNLGTPSDFHRFDRGNPTGTFMLRNVFMYLFANGVRDFFTESELNMAYRDYGEDDTEKFYDPYGGSFSDFNYMFRSDIITKPIYYKYDLSLSTSKLFNNFEPWGSLLPRDYNPLRYESCFQYYPKRAVYSLQHQPGLRRDNWKSFLPLNFRDFSGKISNIKSLNSTGAVILFEDNEPVQFKGVDELQTTGDKKIIIGDGGLFANNMQGMVNADDALDYGACISSRSAVNTPYGLFWISQKNGKIMHFSGQVSEISRDGLKFWFSENLPSKLLKDNPDYALYDNPVAGIGCQSIYDPQYELVYFSKKDFVPLRTDLIYDDPSGVPYFICGSTPIPPADHRDLNVIDNTQLVPIEEESACLIDLAFSIDVGPSVNTSELLNLKQFLIAFVNNTQIQGLINQSKLKIGMIMFSDRGYGAQLNLTGSTTEIINYINTHIPTSQQSGGTNTAVGLANARGILFNQTYATPDAYKKIVLLTDGWPNAVINPDAASNSVYVGDRVYTIPAANDFPCSRTLFGYTDCDRCNIYETTMLIAHEIKTIDNVEIIAGFLGGETAVDLRDILTSQQNPGNAHSIETYLTYRTLIQGQMDMMTHKFPLSTVNTSPYYVASGYLPANPLQAGHLNNYGLMSGSTSSGNPVGVPYGRLLYGTLSSTTNINAYSSSATSWPALPSAYSGLVMSANSQFNPYGIYDCEPATHYPLTSVDQDNKPKAFLTTFANAAAVMAPAIAAQICTQSISCLINVNNSDVFDGDEVLLSWSSIQADEATIAVTYAGSTQPFETYDVPVNGTASVFPLAPGTTYTLTVINTKDDTSHTCTLTLAPKSKPPVISKCPCPYDNPECFESAGWTASYDPKTKTWVSFHDWIPDLTIPSYSHFFTVKGGGIWKHNEKWDSYCKFYNKDYPWEVEIPIANLQGVTTLRSVEYWMEAYKYYNEGRDFNHVLDENFDTAIIYNSEQNSGVLKLKVKYKGDPFELLEPPVITQNNMQILVAKEENKYRFNQFWDNTNDRGEFTLDQTPMWITSSNGYRKVVNPQYINYNKPPLQRKKFRHYGNRIVLRKTVSSDKKMILKLGSTKHQNSPR